jgi:hypothetical protein
MTLTDRPDYLSEQEAGYNRDYANAYGREWRHQQYDQGAQATLLSLAGTLSFAAAYFPATISGRMVSRPTSPNSLE